MGDVNKVTTFPDIMRKCFKMGLFKSEYGNKDNITYTHYYFVILSMFSNYPV